MHVQLYIVSHAELHGIYGMKLMQQTILVTEILYRHLALHQDRRMTANIQHNINEKTVTHSLPHRATMTIYIISCIQSQGHTG